MLKRFKKSLNIGSLRTKLAIKTLRTLNILVNLFLTNLLYNGHQLSEEHVCFTMELSLVIITSRGIRPDVIKSVQGHRTRAQGKFHSFSELCSSSMKWKKLHEMTHLKNLCKWKALDKCTGIL